MMSVISTTTSAANSGVATRLAVDPRDELLAVELVAHRHDLAQQTRAHVSSRRGPRRRGAG